MLDGMPDNREISDGVADTRAITFQPIGMPSRSVSRAAVWRDCQERAFGPGNL